MGADITVVVVTYRSAATIGDCLRSLDRASTSHSVSAVVVDNASDDGSADVARRLAAEIATPVEVLERATNDGFAAGCNAGLDRADGQWVAFLNPDTQCPPGALDALARVAASRPDAGVVAPALVSPDGTLQPTVERTYRLGRLLLGLLRLGGANRPTAPPPSGPPVEVGWVHAAVLLMPVDFARGIGGFDDRYFLYMEDMDLCTRVRDAGRVALVAPEVRVHHIGGASGALSGGAPVIADRRVESLARYLEIHQGRWAAMAFAGATVVSAGLMTALELVTRRPTGVHRSMTRAAWRALRDRADRRGLQ